jgi:class 3 adenylate cyclase
MTKDEHKVTRCYAKYIFLDVVQFSKRSAEAQSEIVGVLNQIVDQALQSFEVTDDDTILIPTGDGLCIALINPSFAYDIHIQLALDILNRTNEYNTQAEKETRRFHLRIGINQNTDILVADINGRRNVAGAGINMASRIMDQADAGQILVSQAVFHELQPSERYMDKFRLYSATGKHKTAFQLYQYTGENHLGLNREVPSAFAPRKAQPKKLSEQVAYYFVQASIHRKDLLQIRTTSRVFWEDAAIILLKSLAIDSYELSKASEFADRPSPKTHGAGQKSFAEQYAYYQSQDTWVRWDAESNVINADVDNRGLKLVDYSECFESSDYEFHYAFINPKGITKLKEEYPQLWSAHELDKYMS